jgi:hypothetical protein
LLREFVWWWLVAGLAAIAACYLMQLPLIGRSAAWLRRRWPASKRPLLDRAGDG